MIKADTRMTKRVKVETTAVDDRGPTREWLSEVWKQMGHQFVEQEEEREGCFPVELFTPSGSFLVPQANSHLQDNGNIRAYYRAVGRILLYCMGQNNAVLGQENQIPVHVLVSLFMCVADEL
jgi:hypothetical protein